MPVILTLDIGNTFVKAAAFVDGVCGPVHRYAHTELPGRLLEAAKIGNYGSEVQYIGMVSVGKEDMMRSLAPLQATFPAAGWLEINRSTPLPVGISYRTPETLGMDRVCSAVGGRHLAGAGPLLTIDAGTAITYDYIDRDGNYRGGGISPGLRTRFRALNDYTAALPLISEEGRWPLVGDDTATSIRSGVVNGLLAEVEGIAARYRKLAGPDLQVALTGGDAEFLGNHLKNINFVDSNLLLRGIWAIVLHQMHHA
ncbi:MAG: type III pantothenate kinase [Bacteroidota bacterium]